MAKKTKVPRNNEEQDEDVRRALRIAYEVDRWQWLSGNKPLPPMSPPAVPAKPTKKRQSVKTEKRQSIKTEMVLRVLPMLYPDGTDEISTAAVRRRVIADPSVIAECKRLGTKLPSRAVVGRALGRWR